MSYFFLSPSPFSYFSCHPSFFPPYFRNLKTPCPSSMSQSISQSEHAIIPKAFFIYIYIYNCKINTLAFTSEPLFSACSVVCCSLKIYISVCSFIYKHELFQAAAVPYTEKISGNFFVFFRDLIECAKSSLNENYTEFSSFF